MPTFVLLPEFSRLLALDTDTDTDTGLLVCSQKAKIQNKHKTQVKYRLLSYHSGHN